MAPLTGMLRLNFTNNNTGAVSSVQKLLVVPSKEFTVSGKLNNVDAAPSKDVIAESETAKAFVIKFSSNAWNETLAANKVELPVYNNTAANIKSVFFPMLPVDGFTGMDVYLVNASEAALKVVKTANFNIPAGKVQPVNIEIAADAKFDHYIAYDQASLINAAKNAPKDATIEVLKPITVENGSVAVAKGVTIEGEAITLGEKASMSFTTAGATVKSDIVLDGGGLTPSSATFNKLIVAEEAKAVLTASGEFAEIENNGSLTVGDEKSAVNINAGKVTNNGYLEIADKASVNATSTALDNKGEVYQYVGSVIGAKGIANAAAATYTCEVTNQTKFDEAVERKATKIVLNGAEKFMVPAEGAENVTIEFRKEARLCCDSNKDASGKEVEVTGVVKGIISNCGAGNYGARIDQNLTVGTGGILVKEDKALKVLMNITVNVNGKITLEKNAKFEREQGGADGVEAKVNCTGIATGQGAEWIGGQPNY